jgi:hypothetical protein
MSGDSGQELSRRDFLKMLGASIGIGVLGGLGFGELIKRNPDLIHKEPLALTPEIVDGVEVYGLKEKITSDKIVDGLYAYLDDRFAKSVGTVLVDKVKQRKEFLDPNQRFLEVEVRRSAYDSFINTKDETGLSFPEWIKIHVDVMNRCLEKASCEMRAVLRRVVVIEDEGAQKFWDEGVFRQGTPLGSALDVAWVQRFWSFTFDTDSCWAIADDYRNSGGGKFWEIRHESDGENQKTIIGRPPGQESFDQYFEFPEINDSLAGKNNVKIDMGLVHEWCHYLLNLPDEYGQDVHDSAMRFKSFTVGTGSFEYPDISPYLVSLIKENKKDSMRDAYLGGGMRNDYYKVRPREIEIAAKYENEIFPESMIEVRRVRLLDESYYGKKSVPERADRSSETNTIKLDDGLFQEKSNCWHIKVGTAVTARELFLPMAAFNMTKIAGLDSAQYEIVFSGYDSPERTWQELKLVDDKEIDKCLSESSDPYYAKMKVTGTSTWMVWFLRG